MTLSLGGDAPADYAWLELRWSTWYPCTDSPVLAEPLAGAGARSGWRNGRGLPETGLPVFERLGRFGPQATPVLLSGGQCHRGGCQSGAGPSRLCDATGRPEMVMRFGREAPILTA